MLALCEMASDLNNRASIFKGEGGANIVLRYNNSEKSNLVIRIRKTRQDDEIGTARASLSALEQETWQELFSAAEPSSLLAVDLIYITRIMAPLIGLQYIPPQVSTTKCWRQRHHSRHISTACFNFPISQFTTPTPILCMFPGSYAPHRRRIEFIRCY